MHLIMPAKSSTLQFFFLLHFRHFIEKSFKSVAMQIIFRIEIDLIFYRTHARTFCWEKKSQQHQQQQHTFEYNNNCIISHNAAHLEQLHRCFVTKIE